MVVVENENKGRNEPSRKAAFTLLEITIVVFISAIILAIAVPNFIQARSRSQASACIANLRMIESAKSQWGIDNNAGPSSTPQASDLVSPTAAGGYLRSMPTCPAGGAYTIGNMSQRTTCTISGHVVP